MPFGLEALLPGLEARSPQEQIDLHFALAKVYEDIGEPARAFAQLVVGNRKKRQQISFDESIAIGLVDNIRDVFTAELIAAKTGAGDPSERPIFIIGMPRSGTTLIEQILASHPHVHGAGEREDFRNAIASVDSAQRGYPQLVPDLTGEQLRAISPT